MINVLIKKELKNINEIKYILEIFSVILGVPFNEKNEGSYKEKDKEVTHIFYGINKRDKQGIYIPDEDYDLWREGDLKCFLVEGIPVLTTKKDFQNKIYFRDEGKFVFNFDIFSACFFLLSRQEERIDKRRDKWKLFSGHYTLQKEFGILQYPIVNQYIFLIKKALQEIFDEKQFSKSSLWKDNKKFSVALVHDIDQPFKGDLQSGLNLIKCSLNLKLKGAKQGLKMILKDLSRSLKRDKDPYFNFDRYMELENQYGFRSSFNFTACERIENPSCDTTYSIYHPKIINAIRSIKQRGWEVGLHGSYQSFLNKERLLEEKTLLEDVYGDKIIGISQHYLRVEHEKTWKIQQECGFLYDTSLGYNEEIGFRAGIAFPYFPYSFLQSKTIPILLLPLVIMDGVLFQEKGLNPDKAIELCKKLLFRIKENNGFAVILWHLRVLDEKDFPGWGKVYAEVLDFLYKEDAWVTNPGEIAMWWLNRIQFINNKN